MVIVHAKDNQDHGAAEDESIKITVIIKDINDERPVFVNLPKTVNFSEVCYNEAFFFLYYFYPHLAIYLVHNCG